MQRKLNDEFIREYSEEFSEKITSEFFAEKERITGKEILNVSPSKQLNFFILKILFRKWQEEMKKLESPFFNYKSPEVRKAMVQFMNTLSQHIEVSGDHFISMAEEAVADTLLLAVDPGSYLSLEFEAMDVSKVTDKMTKPILKYIKLHKEEISAFFAENEGADIDEFVENASDYFDDLEVGDIVQNQLELLSQIVPLSEDDLYFKEEDELDLDEEEDELPEVDDSILDDEDDESAIEPEEDEDSDEEVSFDYPEEEESETLNHTDDEGTDEELSESEESAELVDSEEESEDSEEASDDDDEEKYLAEDGRDSYSEETFDEDDEENEDGTIEEEKISDESEEDSVSAADDETVPNGPASEDDESVNEKFAEQSPTINDKFSKEDDDTVAGNLEKKPVSTIMEAISVNHRYMFTKELFDGNREAFTAAIENIESQESFDDAVEMLVQRYANKLGWDMNSDEVKELLKVIFRRFR